MLCNYYTIYTKLLHNILIHYAKYEIELHKIWFYMTICSVKCFILTLHKVIYLIFLYVCCTTFFHMLSVGTMYYFPPHTCQVTTTFRHATCVNISTGVPVTMNESTVYLNVLTYTRILVCCFVCFFVVIKPENPYSASYLGLEVNPLGAY